MSQQMTLANRALGTANWKHFEDGTNSVFSNGDIWLGRGPNGDSVGHHDGRNVLVVAGPRSGKGTGFIVPNLLLWSGSAFVNDPKGENALVTARVRGHGSRFAYGRGQTSRIFDPYNEVRREDDDFADLKVRFNPLDFLRPGSSDPVGYAGRIGDALVIPEESSGDSGDWRESSSQAIADIALHVASAPWIRDNERNLITVRRLLIEGDLEMATMAAMNRKVGDDQTSGLQALFEGMIRNDAFGGVVAQTGMMYLQTLKDAPRQLTGMLFSARNAMKFLKDDAMQEAMAVSDFSIDELKSDPYGMTLYSCLPQRHMSSHDRVPRLLTSLILARMEELSFQPCTGHPTLMMLDEFAGLRRMRPIEDAAAQINAHGVKMVFVVQSLAQLKETYRDGWETLVASCGVKVFFNNEDHFTREYASKLTGETEVVRRTRSGSQSSGTSRGKSDGTSTHSSGSTTTSSSYSHGESWSLFGGEGSSSSSVSWSRSETSTSGYGSSQTKNEGSNQSITDGWSDSVHRRPLLHPDEVGRLFGDSDFGRSLVLASGSQPMALVRIPYFREKIFEGYFDPHPHHPSPPLLIGVKARHDADRRMREHIEWLRAHEDEINAARMSHEMFVVFPLWVLGVLWRITKWGAAMAAILGLTYVFLGVWWAAAFCILAAAILGLWLKAKWSDDDV